MSPRTFRRHFRVRRAINPHLWLDQLRLHKAAELIAAGTPIKDVYPQLGFKQFSHFSAWFKRCYGVCPRNYRRFARLEDIERDATQSLNTCAKAIVRQLQ